VPGAGPAATPGPPVPGQINAAGVQAAISNVGQPLSTSKNATTNYEVDKTIRHTKQSVGAIKRLSAAIVVNYRKDAAKGGTKPLPDAELKQINDVVKEAMGYSKERGDTISLANAPFTVVDKSDLEIPLWKDPEVVSLGKDLFKYLAIAAIIAYLLLGVVRPLLKTMFPPKEEETPPGSQIDVVAGEEGAEGEEVGELSEAEAAKLAKATSLEKQIEEARNIAQNDPKIIANIIKEWAGAGGN
jgi:flagellar M-ring protein FliF